MSSVALRGLLTANEPVTPTMGTKGKAAILPVNIVSYRGNRVGADNPHFVAGMPIVVDGNERLRPDQPVSVVPANGK